MKKYIYTIIFVFAIQLSNAQNCNNPISTASFQLGFNQVAVMPNNDTKFAKAMNLLTNTCLMSENIKSMSQLFTDDAFRLEYCKAAYTHAFDRANYYQVYDAFTKFSAAFMLHDYILSVNGGVATVVPTPIVTTPVPPAPAPCLVTDADFKKLIVDFDNQHFTDDKMKMFNTVSKDRCFKVEQVRAISKQFPFDDEKLIVFKSAYAKCTERPNYYKLGEELTFTANKDQLSNYIKSH